MELHRPPGSSFELISETSFARHQTVFECTFLRLVECASGGRADVAAGAFDALQESARQKVFKALRSVAVVSAEMFAASMDSEIWNTILADLGPNEQMRHRYPFDPALTPTVAFGPGDVHAPEHFAYLVQKQCSGSTTGVPVRQAAQSRSAASNNVDTSSYLARLRGDLGMRTEQVQQVSAPSHASVAERSSSVPSPSPQLPIQATVSSHDARSIDMSAHQSTVDQSTSLLPTWLPTTRSQETRPIEEEIEKSVPRAKKAAQSKVKGKELAPAEATVPSHTVAATPLVTSTILDNFNKRIESEFETTAEEKKGLPKAGIKAEVKAAEPRQTANPSPTLTQRQELWDQHMKPYGLKQNPALEPFQLRIPKSKSNLFHGEAIQEAKECISRYVVVTWETIGDYIIITLDIRPSRAQQRPIRVFRDLVNAWADFDMWITLVDRGALLRIDKALHCLFSMSMSRYSDEMARKERQEEVLENLIQHHGVQMSEEAPAPASGATLRPPKPPQVEAVVKEEAAPQQQREAWKGELDSQVLGALCSFVGKDHATVEEEMVTELKTVIEQACPALSPIKKARATQEVLNNAVGIFAGGHADAVGPWEKLLHKVGWRLVKSVWGAD